MKMSMILKSHVSVDRRGNWEGEGGGGRDKEREKERERQFDIVQNDEKKENRKTGYERRERQEERKERREKREKREIPSGE